MSDAPEQPAIDGGKQQQRQQSFSMKVLVSHDELSSHPVA